MRFDHAIALFHRDSSIRAALIPTSREAHAGAEGYLRTEGLNGGMAICVHPASIRTPNTHTGDGPDNDRPKTEEPPSLLGTRTPDIPGFPKTESGRQPYVRTRAAHRVLWFARLPTAHTTSWVIQCPLSTARRT